VTKKTVGVGVTLELITLFVFLTDPLNSNQTVTANKTKNANNAKGSTISFYWKRAFFSTNTG